VTQKLNPLGTERSKNHSKETFFMRILTLFLLSCFFILNSPLAAETMEINGFEFENPLGPTQVTELGPGAYSASWPKDKPYKQASVELIVVNVGPDAVKSISESGQSVYETMLVSFMGLTVEPEQINKTLFFGSTSARRVYNSNVPREHSANVFSKILDDGSFVLVGVRIFETRQGGGDLIRSIANTFERKDGSK
jgi:hypothetical protein